VTETSSLFNQCHGNADPDGGTNFSPDCGLVITAVVVPTPGNPGLSRYLQVGVIDQGGGYEALTGIERSLQKLDALRKEKELKAATENVDGPQL
jgi:hypothetical protein